MKPAAAWRQRKGVRYVGTASFVVLAALSVITWLMLSRDGFNHGVLSGLGVAPARAIVVALLLLSTFEYLYLACLYWLTGDKGLWVLAFCLWTGADAFLKNRGFLDALPLALFLFGLFSTPFALRVIPWLARNVFPGREA